MQNRAWRVYLPMTQRGRVFCPAKTEGCMTWLPFKNPARFRVTRTILNLESFRVLRTWENVIMHTLPITFNLWKILPVRNKKTRTHSEPVRQFQLHDSRPSTIQLVFSQVFPGLSVLHHTRGSQASSCNCVSQKIQQTCRAVVKPPLKHKPLVSHKIGTEQIKQCTVV